MGIFSDYFMFIVNPGSDLEQPDGWSKRFSGTIKVFFITWLLLILAGILRLAVAQTTDLTIPQRGDIEQMIRNSFGGYAVLYWIVLLGPLTEELIFRLSLTSYKEQYLRFSFALALSYLFVFRIRLNLWPDLQYGLQLFLFFFTMMLIALVLFYLFSFIKNFSLSRVWERHFGVVFYGAALMFAFMHLPVYNFEGFFFEILATKILIIVPYFIIGISLGYIRIRFGFLYALFFHAFWNLLSVAVIYYRMSLT